MKRPHQKVLRLDKEIDDLIANRHLARRGCFDNVLCFIKKNSGEVHPCYVIQCQYKQLEKDKRWLKLCYPNRKLADKFDDPNTIHQVRNDKETKLLQKSFHTDGREDRTS